MLALADGVAVGRVGLGWGGSRARGGEKEGVGGNTAFSRRERFRAMYFAGCPRVWLFARVWLYIRSL